MKIRTDKILIILKNQSIKENIYIIVLISQSIALQLQQHIYL